jgi:signal transduction histidine kinase
MPRIMSQEHEARARIADALARRTDDVVDRWFTQVTRDATVQHIEITDLEVGIREYLRRLVEVLHGDEQVEVIGAIAWRDVARAHALTRVRLGFDISQLVHELVLLRRTTREILEEEGLATELWTERLLWLFDDAMRTALHNYVDSRDYAARRSEAEHVGFLTHELKNPLGTAMLAIEQLRRIELPGEQRHLCDVIDRNLDRIRRMIDDVLLTERLEAGAVNCRPVETTVGQLVSESLSVFGSQAKAKRIGLVQKYDPQLRLYLDPNLTVSAIEHLLDNAIKFTEVGEVTFAVEDRPSEVAFHVRDRCSGLSREELRVIFEPFERSHPKHGTGLGLAIARRAVEVQGGTMSAECEGEVGCHFWFTLPKVHH